MCSCIVMYFLMLRKLFSYTLVTRRHVLVVSSSLTDFQNSFTEKAFQEICNEPFVR